MINLEWGGSWFILSFCVMLDHDVRVYFLLILPSPRYLYYWDSVLLYIAVYNVETSKVWMH